MTGCPGGRHVARLIAASCMIAVPLTCSRASATVDLAGDMSVGRVRQPSSLHFSCILAGGRAYGLLLKVDVPDAARLERVFDVGPFEGPDGIAARLHVSARRLGRSVAGRFGTTGSFGDDGAPSSTFTFEAYASSNLRLRNSFGSMRDLARVVADGPARLAVSIEGPRVGSLPIAAWFVVDEDDARRLGEALKPCAARERVRRPPAGTSPRRALLHPARDASPGTTHPPAEAGSRGGSPLLQARGRVQGQHPWPCFPGLAPRRVS